MKTKILSLTIVGGLCSATAVADLQGITWDAVDSGLGIGTTYRIYASIDAGGEVDAVYGDSTYALLIETSLGGGFYQNEFGGYSAPNPALFGSAGLLGCGLPYPTGPLATAAQFP